MRTTRTGSFQQHLVAAAAAIQLLATAVFDVVAAQQQEQYAVVSQTPSNVPVSQVVDYECLFDNRWTPDRHPNDYPAAARWIEPVVVTHSDLYTMFSPGSLASNGVKQMATRGNKAPLFVEIVQSNPETGGASAILEVKSAGSMLLSRRAFVEIDDVEVDSSHPYVSLISKIDPSPDWYTGLNAFDMRDAASNTWLYNVTIDLYPWDAGIFAGDTYVPSQVVEENPQKPIERLVAGSVFDNPEGTGVLPVAQLSCQLTNGVPASATTAPVAAASVVPAPTPPAAAATPAATAPPSPPPASTLATIAQVPPTPPPTTSAPSPSPTNTPSTSAPTTSPTRTQTEMPTVGPTEPPTSMPTTAATAAATADAEDEEVGPDDAETETSPSPTTAAPSSVEPAETLSPTAVATSAQTSAGTAASTEEEEDGGSPGTSSPTASATDAPMMDGTTIAPTDEQTALQTYSPTSDGDGTNPTSSGVEEDESGSSSSRRQASTLLTVLFSLATSLLVAAVAV